MSKYVMMDTVRALEKHKTEFNNSDELTQSIDKTLELIKKVVIEGCLENLEKPVQRTYNAGNFVSGESY